MKRLIIYIKDKGGCGASFACVAHATLLRRAGFSPLLVDTDGEIGHLRRNFPAEDVRSFSFHAVESDRVDFAEILDERREIVLIDMPAASLTLMDKIERDYGFVRLAHAAGYAVTFVCVGTPDPASLYAVEGAADLDPDAALVFVRNHGFGENRDFLVWDGSPADDLKPHAGKAVLAARGGYDLHMPLLDRGTVALMSAYGITFESISHPKLKSGRRSQVETFLARLKSELRKAGAIMGLETAVPA